MCVPIDNMRIVTDAYVCVYTHGETLRNVLDDASRARLIMQWTSARILCHLHKREAIRARARIYHRWIMSYLPGLHREPDVSMRRRRLPIVYEAVSLSLSRERANGFLGFYGKLSACVY